jgi:NADPH:quinone reductase-like Zn-dependent oxidoreductase
MMKSWNCPEKGVENIVLEEKEIPKPENPTDIVVKMRASGLNPVDWKKCSW